MAEVNNCNLGIMASYAHLYLYKNFPLISCIVGWMSSHTSRAFSCSTLCNPPTGLLQWSKSDHDMVQELLNAAFLCCHVLLWTHRRVLLWLCIWLNFSKFIASKASPGINKFNTQLYCYALVWQIWNTFPFFAVLQSVSVNFLYFRCNAMYFTFLQDMWNCTNCYNQYRFG